MRRKGEVGGCGQQQLTLIPTAGLHYKPHLEASGWRWATEAAQAVKEGHRKVKTTLPWLLPGGHITCQEPTGAGCVCLISSLSETHGAQGASVTP